MITDFLILSSLPSNVIPQSYLGYVDYDCDGPTLVASFESIFLTYNLFQSLVLHLFISLCHSQHIPSSINDGCMLVVVIGKECLKFIIYYSIFELQERIQECRIISSIYFESLISFDGIKDDPWLTYLDFSHH